jgi:hypothetical protein
MSVLLMVFCSELRWYIHKKYNLLGKSKDNDVDAIKESNDFKFLYNSRIIENFIVILLLITNTTLNIFLERSKETFKLPGIDSMPKIQTYEYFKSIKFYLSFILSQGNIVYGICTPYFMEE